jgi:hypothetical protein
MLARSQQLPDALANLHQYLILEPIPRAATATDFGVAVPEAGAPQLRLLLPDGMVCRRDDEVYVEVSDDVSSSVRHVIYDYDDRFRQFKASEIGTRLQLAALHAATSTLLPEPRIGMTGTAMAMTLVRQSWVQHPLGPEELAKLANVAKFSTRVPALHLLCYALECSSLQLGFLHPREDGGGQESSTQVKKLQVPRRDEDTAAVPFDADAATEYRIGMARRAIGLHHQLAPEEEQLVFRFTVLPVPKAHVQRSPPLTTAAGRERFVQSLEQALAACVQDTPPRDGTAKPECPVAAGEDATALDRYHAERCQSSWDLHHALPARTLDSERLRSINIDGSLMSVQMRQSKLEQQMREILEGQARGATMVFRIRRAANLVPRATVSDSVRCAWLPHAALLQRLNPHLSDDQCLEYRSAIVQWLQLCVLYDRLLRLRHLVQAFDHELALDAESRSQQQKQQATALQYVEHQLVQELLTKREWDPVDHTVARFRSRRTTPSATDTVPRGPDVARESQRDCAAQHGRGQDSRHLASPRASPHGGGHQLDGVEQQLQTPARAVGVPAAASRRRLPSSAQASLRQRRAGATTAASSAVPPRRAAHRGQHARPSARPAALLFLRRSTVDGPGAHSLDAAQVRRTVAAS